jgi:hypothetical protein
MDDGLFLAYGAERQRRAPFVAELAWRRHLNQDYDDVVALEPIYLGNPVKEQASA